MEDFRRRKRKEGEDSLWQQMGREEEKPSRWGEWFKKRIIGEKTAREIAEEEEAEKIKKNNGF